MPGREHRIPPTSRSVHKPRVGKIQDGPWMPQISQRGSTALYYDGPLPARCSCTSPHIPLRGTDGHEVFHSTFAAGFGKLFCSLSLDSPQKFVEDVPLRARALSHTSSSVSLSLSHAPSCVSKVFFHWLVLLCLCSLRCVVSWCTHSKFPHRLCWLRICFGILQTLEIRRLFSFL